MAAPNSNLTSELRTKWAGPVLNQQDWAKNGWGHLKSGWGEVDSACAHAWQRVVRRLWAWRQLSWYSDDDLPAFVLLISMVRRLLILLLFPPPPHPPALLPSPPSNSPPFTPLPHSYAFVFLPKTPPVTTSPHVSSFKYTLHGFVSQLQTFLEAELDTVACIHIRRVKRTIVHSYGLKQICMCIRIPMGK